MEKVNVGITMPLDKSLVEMIKAVSPRLNVLELGELVIEEARAQKASPQLDEGLGKIEVLFYTRPPVDLLARAPRLQWAQCHSAGVESLIGEGKPAPHFVVTNATGVADIPIAEHCFMFMLNFVKGTGRSMERQRDRVYTPEAGFTGFLEGKTLGIVGMGGIGGEVARLAKAFHMRVVATRRTATRQSNVGDADGMFPPEQLHDLLRESDFVVLALPLTRATARIIGEAELKVMKPSAYIVNVGRGKLIDEAALVRALKEGAIAGAGLDVFETEPLPRDSELWDMPNVMITSHLAGRLIDKTPRAARFFCDNLRRYLAGEPLRSVRDPAAGY